MDELCGRLRVNCRDDGIVSVLLDVWIAIRGFQAEMYSLLSGAMPDSLIIKLWKKSTMKYPRKYLAIILPVPYTNSIEESA